MSKRIVIALGGNALGSNLEEQMKAVKNTAVAIADLIEEGNEIVIAHGNGPTGWDDSECDDRTQKIKS